MCMELLNGAPLNDMITQPMPVDRLLNILIQTGHGLAAAHAKNIVHRDMKPENIYVTIGPNGEDVPKLLDFGIAKVAGNDGQNHLTRTGTIFGTPFYMAPEQALGNQVDARTDIYAVGVIMYEVFAGSLPFQGDSFMGILTQHITTDPEPVAQRAAKAGRQLPGNLADIITRCMRKNPAERFSSMDELVGELVRIYRGIAGAGMSSYMEAFPVPATSGHQIQPTPPPMNAVGAGASQPFMPPQRGGTGPNPILPPSASGGLYDPSQHPVDVAGHGKKSNTGLIVAIIILLAAGGGVAAFLIMNNKSDGKGKTAGTASGTDQVALVDDKPTKPVGSDVKPPPTPPPHDDKTVPPVGSNNAVTNAVVDAGAGSATETKPIEPIAPVKAKVFLQGTNVGRYDVYDDTGKKLDEPMVFVEKDKTITVTIKASGYKDKQLVVDDKKDIVQFRLDAKPGVTPPVNPPHNVVNHNPPPPDQGHHGLDQITNNGKPPTEDCSKRKLRPHDAACIKQYCKAHSGIDGCPEED